MKTPYDDKENERRIMKPPMRKPKQRNRGAAIE